MSNTVPALVHDKSAEVDVIFDAVSADGGKQVGGGKMLTITSTVTP